MDRVFQNAANMSEFVSGRHGTCGELATLAALHVTRPDDWPMTPASLERIAAWAIAHGASNPSGAETPATIRAFLDAFDVRHSEHAPSELPRLLLDLAGIHPIIVEYSNA